MTRKTVLWFVAAFATVFLVGASSLGAAAYWTAAAQPLTGTVRSATTVLTAGQSGLATEYRFAGAATSAANIASGSLVFANPGTASLSLTAVPSSDNAALAPHIAVYLWPVSAGACGAAVPATGFSSGTLASASLPLPAAASSVAAGSSVTICAATKLDGAVVTYQGQVINPVITLTGRIGTNWVTTAGTPAFTQKVYRVPDVGTITCTENPGTLTIGGTVTLRWDPVPGATSYTVHRTSTTTASFRTVAPATPTVSTTIGAGDLGLTGLLSSVPVVVQTWDSAYGTYGAGKTVVLRTALLPLLSVVCPL